MELQIAGTNVELTQDVQSYIERKLGKLDRFSPGLNEARVEISEEGTKSPDERYLVRVTLTSGASGAVFHGEERGEDLLKAVDKISGVTPVVAGVLRNKLGNLTSAVALKLTLMGMLSKTERKRFTYGEGLKEIAGLVLDILDKAGIYRTDRAEREVDIIFPSPLPENMTEKLKEAQIKKELGVPTEQVLRELGYETRKEEKNSK